MRKAAITGTLLTILMLTIATPALTQTAALGGQTICLDPGHGGSDPGAVYDDGTIYIEEADINLDVSYGLRALLEGDGATVVMTRVDDSYRDNRDRYTFCNDKGATILVSVHTNSTSDPTTDGSMALYFHRDDEVLAQAIYDVMYPELKETAPDPSSFRGFGLDKFASGVLLKSDMPSAMMEPLFMSHPAEARLLTIPVYLDHGVTPNPDCNDCRRAQIAKAIYGGILTYVGASEDAPPSVRITSPADGDTVSGTVTVTADASGDDGIAQVEVFVDGSSIGVDRDGSDGWSTSWDTTGFDNGSYTIGATATDTAGQTASDAINVMVDNSGTGGGISLEATGMKVRGLQKADLTWTGATSDNVDILRDGAMIATTGNDGSFRDNIDERGSGSYTYQVCEAGTSTCSNEATVTF